MLIAGLAERGLPSMGTAEKSAGTAIYVTGNRSCRRCYFVNIGSFVAMLALAGQRRSGVLRGRSL